MQQLPAHSSYRQQRLWPALMLGLGLALPLHADDSSKKGATAQTQVSNGEKGEKQTGPSQDVSGSGTPAGESSSSRSEIVNGLLSGDPGKVRGNADTTLNSPATEVRQDAAGAASSDTDNKPGFNQGFQNKDAAAQQLQNASGSFGGNPLNALTGGSSTGGTGATGVAAQGKGAISEGGFFGTTTRNGSDQVDNNAGQADSAGKSKGQSKEPDKVTKSEDGKTIIHGRSDGSSTTIARREGGTTKITQIDKDGKVSVEFLDSNNKIVDKEKADEIEKKAAEDKKNKEGENKPATACRQGLEGCNDPAALDAFLRAHPAVAAQIEQSKSGGSPVDPGRGDSSNFAVGAGAVVPTSSAVGQSLLGQPGRVREGGAINTSTNFNGNVGAIDPGPDANISGSGRQDDPGAVFNNKPSPQRELRTPTSKDCEDSKGKTKRLIAIGTASTKKKDDCGK